MAGCGGGGTGGPASPPLAPPAPAMTVQSGAIARVIAKDTSVEIEVTAQAANFTPTGTLYASASDGAGLVQAPVAIRANGGGSYTFVLDTVASKADGHYTGNLTIKLCSDQACGAAQAVPSISVPFDVTVQGRDSAWPGDKLSALSAWSGVPDWATFQGNNAHTGYVPVEVKPDQMLLRWKRAAVNGSTSGYSASMSPLVTSNGRFFASSDKKLTAYQESDGKPVWSYDTSGLAYPSVNPPAVDGGVVYMAAGQQSSTFMMSFDGADGTLRMKSAMSSQWENYLSPVVQGGGVYTNAGSYGGLYAFATSGERLFVGALSQTSMWSPAADARAIYAYTGDALTLFEPKTVAV
jgi:outer membrane protein assembly factor BamB